MLQRVEQKPQVKSDTQHSRKHREACDGNQRCNEQTSAKYLTLLLHLTVVNSDLSSQSPIVISKILTDGCSTIVPFCLAVAPIHKQAPRATVQTTTELPDTAPTANRGLSEFKAVIKNIVSGAEEGKIVELYTLVYIRDLYWRFYRNTVSGS